MGGNQSKEYLYFYKRKLLLGKLILNTLLN